MKKLFMMALVAALAMGCGGSKNTEQAAQGSVTTLGVEEFATVMAQDGVRLIDVRTPQEFATGHLERAENIDVKAPDFAERIKEVSGTVAVYCVKGVRSLNAANQLAAQGCTAYNLDGGLIAWQQAGLPTTKD